MFYNYYGFVLHNYGTKWPEIIFFDLHSATQSESASQLAEREDQCCAADPVVTGNSLPHMSSSVHLLIMCNN